MREHDLIDALEACEILSKDWPTNITVNNIRQLTFRGRITKVLVANGKSFYNRKQVEEYALTRPRSTAGNLARIDHVKNRRKGKSL